MRPLSIRGSEVLSPQLSLLEKEGAGLPEKPPLLPTWNSAISWCMMLAWLDSSSLAAALSSAVA